MKEASLKAGKKTPMEGLEETPGFGEPAGALAMSFAPPCDHYNSISPLCVLPSSLCSLTGPFLFVFLVSLDGELSVACVICCTAIAEAALSPLRLSQWVRRFIKQTQVQQSSFFKLTSIPLSISSSSGLHTAHKFHLTTLAD